MREAISPPTCEPMAGAWVFGVLCTGYAFLLYYRLIQRIGAARAVTVTYLVPIAAVTWAWTPAGSATTACGSTPTPRPMPTACRSTKAEPGGRSALPTEVVRAAASPSDVMILVAGGGFVPAAKPGSLGSIMGEDLRDALSGKGGGKGKGKKGRRESE